MHSADVQVLSTPGCVGCGPTKDTVARVLEDYPALTWEEIDVTEYPEVAMQYRIMSAPAVVIGNEIAFTSVPKEAALRTKLTEYTERDSQP